MNTAKIRKPARICRALACCLTLIAALEVSVRILFGLGEPLLPNTDSEVGQQKAAAREVSAQPIRVVHPNAFQILILANSSMGRAAVNGEEGFAPELERLIRANGDTTAVVNASAGLDIAGQLAYLRKCGTFGSRWVVLQIASDDLLHRKSSTDSSISDCRSALALVQLWSRYMKPRFSRPSKTQPAPRQVQFFENMDDLLDAVALVRSTGAFPLVLHLPARAEIAGFESGEGACTPWRECFLEIMTGEQVPTINLIESWRTDPAAATYFSDQVHLTASGTAAAARRLALFLLSAEHRHTPERPNDIIVRTDRTEPRALVVTDRHF